HRDLKPANVMVGAFGEVQVMDWGLAKVLAPLPPTPQPPPPHRGEGEPDGLPLAPPWERGPGGEGLRPQSGAGLGTPPCLAPEQARGEVERLDERCDVFGLGAILCEILTGQPPYTGRTAPAVRERAARAELGPAWGRLDGCGADAELVALAKRCLAADPAA